MTFGPLQVPSFLAHPTELFVGTVRSNAVTIPRPIAREVIPDGDR